MATFKSSDIQLRGSAQAVFDILSNPGNLKQLVERIPTESIPEDKRGMLDDIEITGDSISFPAGPAGRLTLKTSRLERPELIEMEGVGAPVRLALMMHIRPIDETSSEGRVEIDLDVPMMFRPMVSGPLTRLVDQLGFILAQIPFDKIEE